MVQSSPNIGVLAFQGSFREHVQMLRRVVKDPKSILEVRTLSDLKRCDGMILPGGESTAHGIIASATDSEFFQALRSRIQQGMPVWGTCAGCILLCDTVRDETGERKGFIGGLDVTVHRNHFGRQAESFIARDQEVCLSREGGDDVTISGVEMVFIRAPAIVEVGPKAQVMATVSRREGDGGAVVVGVRQGSIMATAFHPELTEDLRMHEFFCRLVASASALVH